MAASIADRRASFRRLHESGCFVIPNPWDAGSAVWLQEAGFKALATTSSGCAWSLALPDNGVGLEGMLAHLKAIVGATEIPVNADFEKAYADAPEGVARNVVRAAETGVAGLSVEDSTGRSDKPLYDFDLALARVRAARAAIDHAGRDVIFTARTEGFIRGRPDLDETIRRLKAFADAGADCLYSPGIKTREQIVAVVQAVAPKPVNLLMSAALGFTVADVAAMGVRRISVGGTLARVAMNALMRSAREIAEQGRFDSFAGVVANAELNALFREDRKKR